MAKVISLAKSKLTASRFNVANIRNYNRLEASPRSTNFERNLQMEVRDPLWYLCRQWQFGEFQGEDAGSAYQAVIRGMHSSPECIVLKDGTEIPYNVEEPLEMVVEKEAVSPTLFLRAQMGRYFNKLLTANDIQNHKSFLLRDFPIDEKIENDDLEGNYLDKSIANLIPDGYKIFQAIKADEFMDLVENINLLNATERTNFEKTIKQFLSWFRNLYQQPKVGKSTWVPEHLEYNFSMEAKVNKHQKSVLIADQYSSGHLDWKDFDHDRILSRHENDLKKKPQEVIQTFIPTQLKFSGMPHPRLWQLEDSQVDFGKIDASPTSIMNMLLAEYGLTYSNDWFVLPYELEINTLCEIKGIRITDVFGQEYYIGSATKNPEMDWSQFAFFHQSERKLNLKDDGRFYLVPSVGKLQEGDDLEKVNFIRDEMSNMVWAIEHVVPSGSGKGRILKRNVPSLDNFEPADTEAKIRYVLGNTVPDNWIPFIPVHKPVPPGQLPSEIRLQRARVPQGGVPLSKILTESQPVYFIEEEEISRAGINVSRNFQRTRWLNGKTYLWVGRRKKAGRGEGSANLMFDQLVNIKRGEE